MSNDSDEIGRQLRRFKQGLKVRAPRHDETKLPIWQTALLGWQDGFRALGEMPKMAIKGLAVVVVCLLAAFPLARHIPIDKSVGIELFKFGLSIVQVFFLAPVAIAVHRYVLLGEITETYFPDPASARFRRFFLFGVLLEAIWLPATLSNGLLSLLLFCLAVFFGARLIMLFPAVAIDGHGANLSGAWRTSSGHFWRIFATVVLSMLPVLLIFAPARGYLGEAGIVLGALLVPFGVVIATFVAPALASHLYRWLVQRADQPAQP